MDSFFAFFNPTGSEDFSSTNFQLDFLKICILVAISLAGRTALILAGQRWVATFAHTATLTTLPIITFVITNVISGNIALSLGMVGALSIVRFRNPVKSPFELSIYFLAITMGIATSVSLKWLLFLTGSLTMALVLMLIISRLKPQLFGTPYFQTSFSEGNQNSTLEVEASSSLPVLQNSEHLISEYRRQGAFTYILSANNFQLLQSVMRSLEGESAVTEARLNK